MSPRFNPGPLESFSLRWGELPTPQACPHEAVSHTPRVERGLTTCCRAGLMYLVNQEQAYCKCCRRPVVFFLA